MSEQELPPQLPRIPFSVNELLAMVSVIGGYIMYLKALPPTPREARRMAVLEHIHGQLQGQLSAGPTSDVQMPLNPEEIEELLEALTGFVALLQRLFPQNRGRDEVMSTVASWQLRLMSIMTESLSSQN